MDYKYRQIICFFSALLLCVCTVEAKVYDMSRFGIAPGGANLSAKMQEALSVVSGEAEEGEDIVLRFREGQYDFTAEGAARRMYFISNHAEYRGGMVPLERELSVAIPVEGFSNLTIEGNGAVFMFHGCLIPISLVNSKNCRFENFSIDYDKDFYPQIKILECGKEGTTFEVFEEDDFYIDADSTLVYPGLGAEDIRPFYGTVFEPESKRIAYNTGDIDFPNRGLVAGGGRTVYAPRWNDGRLKTGSVMLLRTWDRPCPAIFMEESVNTVIGNVNVFYSQGMGLLAQMCENVTLEGFNVRLSPNRPHRYVSSIVDATHFSQCKGRIISVNGRYENMGDDAINVHGIYLDLAGRLDDYTVIGRFMYEQTYGIRWGDTGDTVQFVEKKTSDIIGSNVIKSIVPYDTDGGIGGARLLKITFAKAMEPEIEGGSVQSIENLTRTPEVRFEGNRIADNRARGSLFTTPRSVIIEDNTYDHVAGSAILISGDCSIWCESGACRDVLIRNNRFINVLTSPYMECRAVITISPLIGDIASQTQYYHGGTPGAFRIVGNEFDTFDAPLLYVKSLDGLVFRDNVIRRNAEFPPRTPSAGQFVFEKAGRAVIF